MGIDSGHNFEIMSPPRGVREEQFSRELTIHVWNNLFGKGMVRGKVEKIVRIYGKPDKVLMTANTRVQFVKPEDENGMITWKSQDQLGVVTLDVDKAERMVTEKDPETGKNRAIIFKEVGKQIKSGNIRHVMWRFSPLNSK